MSVVENVEVIPNRGKWEIASVGKYVHGHIASYRWKFQAVLVARFYCRYRSEQLPKRESVELVIKGRDGKIKEKNTYGYDPESSQG